MLLWKVQNSQQNLLKHSTKINGRVILKKKKNLPVPWFYISGSYCFLKDLSQNFTFSLEELLLIQMLIFMKISQKQALSDMDGIKNWCKCIK